MKGEPGTKGRSEDHELPNKTMKFEMEATDICTAVQFYLNQLVFKEPMYVIAVDKLSLSGSAFRIEFMRSKALDAVGVDKRDMRVDESN